MEQDREERAREQGIGHPTMQQPLNSPKRSWLKPLVWTLVFLAALAALYFFGLAVLVPAD